MEALTVRAPWVDDGAMSRTKSIRKLSVEMREAQLEKERRTAPQRARLKVETTLAVAAFNVRQLIDLLLFGKTGQSFGYDLFCFCRHSTHNFGDWENLFDQSGILSKGERGFICFAGLSSGTNLSKHLCLMLP